jgi:hypothetical protein
MANVWYPKAKEALLKGDIAMDTDDIRVILVDAADYTYSAAHEFLSSVPGGARVGVSPALASKTFTNGLFDAADTTMTGVSGDQSENLIAYQHTGSDATARLILFWDTSIGNSPITPNGGNIDITWHASGIAQL